MLYKYILNGHECWLTKKTGEAITKELQELEDDRKAWENVHKAYEVACRTNDPIDWSIYSDIFKDYWGVRPR